MNGEAGLVEIVMSQLYRCLASQRPWQSFWQPTQPTSTPPTYNLVCNMGVLISLIALPTTKFNEHRQKKKARKKANNYDTTKSSKSQSQLQYQTQPQSRRLQPEQQVEESSPTQELEQAGRDELNPTLVAARVRFPVAT